MQDQIRKIPVYYWLLISALIVLIDQLTKYLAVEHLLLFHSKHIAPFMNFTLMYNMGAAFSFLNAPSNWPRLLFSVIAIVASILIIIWLSNISTKRYILGIGLACILGGALGNLWDRITLGYVVDFIDLYIKHWHWPVFNVADTAITIGVALIVVDFLLQKKKS